MTQLKKREQSTSLTFLRHWGKPKLLKRVNAHAERRELSTSVLDFAQAQAVLRLPSVASGDSPYPPSP